MPAETLDGIYVFGDYSTDGSPYECCNQGRIMLPERLSGTLLSARFRPGQPIPGSPVLANLLTVSQGTRLFKPWLDEFSNNGPLEKYSIVLIVRLGREFRAPESVMCMLSSVSSGTQLVCELVAAPASRNTVVQNQAPPPPPAKRAKK